MKEVLFFLALLTFVPWTLLGQSNAQDSTSYIIASADKVIYSQLNGVEIDSLTGNVELTQDSLLMSSRFAVVKNKTNAFAYGDVVVVQKDSTLIFSDTIVYNGDTKNAALTGEVILVDGGHELYTYRLDYNTETKIGIYEKGAVMFSGLSKLQSNRGVYNGAQKTAYFYENVKFEDSLQVVLADSMLYYINEERIRFLSPANITRDSVQMYSKAGIYDKRENLLILSDDVQIRDGAKIITSGIAEFNGKQKVYTLYFDPYIIDEDGSTARADTIIYFEESGDIQLKGRAHYIASDGSDIRASSIWYNESTDQYSTVGNSTLVDKGRVITAGSFIKSELGAIASLGVIIKDSINQTSIWSDHSQTNDELRSTTIYRLDSTKTLMALMVENDSLYLLSDTLVSTEFGVEDSTYSVLDAFNGVLLIKAGIAGRANYMRFSSADSIIWLYGDPILWSDSLQMRADTIGIYLIDNKIHKVDLIENAFIIMPDSLELFNQIKGEHISNTLDAGAISRSEVKGNAEVLYFVKVGGVFKGLSTTKSLSMVFAFVARQIDQVRLFGNPESTFENFDKDKNYSSQYLSGFSWRLAERPLLDDLLIFQK